MTGKKAYLWIMAAACILLALYLGTGAVSIYRDGQERRAQNPMESIYSPETLAGKAAPIVPGLFMAAGFLLAGLVLGIKDEEADKPVRDEALARDLLVSQVAVPTEEMRRERSVQKRLFVAGWLLFALCMVPVGLHLSDAGHFPAYDPETMFAGLLRVLVPCTVAGLGALAVTGVLRERSVMRESEAAKAARKEEKEKGILPEPVAVKKKRSQGALQAAVVVAAAAFIILGVMNLSARDVLYKAITICSECIGLG